MAEAKRDDLLSSIASTIADYRLGQILVPAPNHVNNWINQFDADVQLALLFELDHVLKKSYVPRATFNEFLNELINADTLVGSDPCDFWKSVNFLSIQGGGSSQKELLALFDNVLQDKCRLSSAQCGSNDGPFVYLDDVIYTGNRIRIDMTNWAPSAPSAVALHVVAMGLHSQGARYAAEKIQTVFRQANKRIKITWWRVLELETLRANRNNSDVLWPSSIPDDPAVQAYAAAMKFKPELRQGSGVGNLKLFSSGDSRNLLEQELLIAGTRVLAACPYLAQNKYMRPLGNSVLETLGFGALIVTFRNCANNCPLAFWAGGPWYPLFPRKTN
jgi:hypothetical protein